MKEILYDKFNSIPAQCMRTIKSYTQHQQAAWSRARMYAAAPAPADGAVSHGDTVTHTAVEAYF
jgi:hypothetical protein